MMVSAVIWREWLVPARASEDFVFSPVSEGHLWSDFAYIPDSRHVHILEKGTLTCIAAEYVRWPGWTGQYYRCSAMKILKGSRCPVQ